MQSAQDTPDYTVRPYFHSLTMISSQTNAPSRQDSDTNPNTTASSIAGDAAQADGRRRRSEATQLRKSILGKKQRTLDESKVCRQAEIDAYRTSF